MTSGKRTRGNKPKPLISIKHSTIQKDEHLTTARSCNVITDHPYSSKKDSTPKEKCLPVRSEISADYSDADCDETTEQYFGHTDGQWLVPQVKVQEERQTSESMRQGVEITEENVNSDCYVTVLKKDTALKSQTIDMPKVPPKTHNILFPTTDMSKMLSNVAKTKKLQPQTTVLLKLPTKSTDRTKIPRKNTVLTKVRPKRILPKPPSMEVPKSKFIAMPDPEPTQAPKDLVLSEEKATHTEGSKLPNEKEVQTLSKTEDKIILSEHCRFCERYFMEEDFHKHMKSMHPGELAYKCTVCGKVYDLNTALKEHVTKEHTQTPTAQKGCVPMPTADSPFICISCNQTFTKVDGLIAHKCTVEQECPRISTSHSPFICISCEQTFAEVDDLIVHNCTQKQDVSNKPTFRNHRPSYSVENKQDISDGENKQDKLTLKDHIAKSSCAVGNTYKCDVCKRSFNSKWLLSNHTRQKHGEYYCTTPGCNKVFKTDSRLAAHKTLHSGEKPYTCEVCGKLYSLRTQLTRHMWSHGNQCKPTCKVCGKSFYDQLHLNKHNRMRTCERLYHCNMCGKSFRTNQARKDHERVHTGEKPFECKTCGKAFARSSALRIHNMRHTGKLPYKCDTCGKSFTERKFLRDHCTIHTGETPYKCELCGQQFPRKIYLNLHAKRHHSDKPRKRHPCQICGKSYLCLRNHMRLHTLHTGRSDYQCTICNKKYSSARNLRKHRRDDHKKHK